ncbi:MAG: tripartite tricarboxylate transporter TctB family protein [Alcaligenaceae bacterium]|jgi:putative tricarboxylic transport membrane protein|nr:tripartite tricarboxylate transporter TctB family protein [Alcaligenaceae bacterium]
MEENKSKPWWLGIAVVLLGAICLYSGSNLPSTAQYAAIGPGLFVNLAGLGLVILGILLTIQIARGERFESQDTENASGSTPMDKRAFITALIGCLIPALTIKTLGLPLTAMLTFTLIARAFGSSKVLIDLICGFLLGALSWLLFSYLGLQLGEFFPLIGV